MRMGSCLAILTVLALATGGCATGPAFTPAPARTYLALPAVTDMEGVVDWLELQRAVAVEVDGLDPASEEVRILDRRILAATEAWVARERDALAAELDMLVNERGLGSQHAEVLELKRAIAALDDRLSEARGRRAGTP